MPPVPAGGRVFVTGGTGLVGSHVAERLTIEGFRVRALHRSGSDTGHLESLACELVEGRLEDGAESLAALMRECDAVVHAAAVVYSDLPWSRVREINVEGTDRVFRGAARAGIPRGVHISSVAVYGDLPGPIDEATSIEGPLRPRARYGRSKREAERAVAKAAGEAGMAVTVLRPSVVYGERDRLFTPKLTGALRLPIQLLLGDGRTTMPTVYAGNLAHAVLDALRAERPTGTRPFNVAGDHALTQRALLNGLAGALGRPFRPIPLPRALVLLGARLGDGLGVRIPGAEELTLARAARLAVSENPYLSDRIRSELGWTPRVGLAEAIARTAAWVAASEGIGETRSA